MKPFVALDCKVVRADFSAYLDGAVSGVEMAAISTHLDGCTNCSTEFSAWREIQQTLSTLGPAQMPQKLQANLRVAIAHERQRGTHLPFLQRVLEAWRLSVAPVALRVSGGLAMAVAMVGFMAYLVAGPISVQANDDKIANLVGPRYLYSEVPPEPVDSQREVASTAPVVVEVMVDAQGRVYDYSILEGPKDDTVRVHVEQNLLASVYKPATVLGTPVRGHILMTFTDVAVHG